MLSTTVVTTLYSALGVTKDAAKVLFGGVPKKDVFVS